MTEEKFKKIVEFERERVKGKEDWEDAECSQCGKGFAISEQDLDEFIDKSKGQLRGYAYFYRQDNWGGLQLCQECFDKLKDTK